jgi:hypothetical protein
MLANHPPSPTCCVNGTHSSTKTVDNTSTIIYDSCAIPDKTHFKMACVFTFCFQDRVTCPPSASFMYNSLPHLLLQTHVVQLSTISKSKHHRVTQRLDPCQLTSLNFPLETDVRVGSVSTSWSLSEQQNERRCQLNAKTT